MTKKTSVLHVDDDPDCLESVARALEHTEEAIDVDSVTDPAAARSRLAADTERIDCVVSEYDLPDTDGLALFEGLREVDTTLPFVLFTGTGSEAIAARAISAGVTDYVRKGAGTDPEALAERVVEIASERPAPSPREPKPGSGLGRTHERDLETTRARFRSLTEHTTLGVVTIDAESTIRYANDAIEDLFGYTPEELTGESLSTVIPDRLEAAHFEAIARYVRAGERRLDWEWIELPARHRDGREIPIGVSFGEFAVDGEVRFTGVIRDITDRKEREEALERSEALLDETQRMTGVGGWELDLATDELRWTAEVDRIYGFSPDYEPTDEALDPFLSEDAAALESAMDRAIGTGDGYDLELRLRRADGELRWVRARGEADREGGETVALRGALQDVTERKRRERELERYEAVVETIDDAVYVLDERGRFEFVNEAFLELTGYEAGSVLGSGVECIKDEPTIERFEDLIGEMLSNGVAETTVEFETRTADGEAIPCEDHLGPRLVDGEFRGVAGVIRNITDRKEREEPSNAARSEPGDDGGRQPAGGRRDCQ